MKGWTRIFGLVLFLFSLQRAAATTSATDCTVPPADLSKIIFKPEPPWYQIHYDIATRVVMSCDKGMYLLNTVDNTYVDRNELSAVCVPPGRWDITVRDFICTDLAAVYCTIPDKLIGLRAEQLTTRFSVGDRITFFCIEGYQISGPTTARCESSGQIFPKPPLCIPLCKLPSYPGLIVKPSKNFYATGEEVELSCEVGYSLGRIRRRVCETSGQFFPDIGSTICTRLGCRAPGMIPYGSYAPRKTYYDFQDRIDYTCDVGYSMVGKAYQICHEGNKFVWGEPRCVGLYCDVPEAIPNAIFRDELKERYAAGDQVFFICKEGYQFKGSFDSITCSLSPDETSASFSERPVCEAIYCQKPKPLLHGEYVEVKATYSVGDTVIYACNVGYVMEGPETATCLQLPGTHVIQFTTPPTCRPNRCQAPPKIQYGGYQETQLYYAIGDIVTYYCKSGYTLSGGRIATCIKDDISGMPGFSGAPTCKPIRCKPPGRIEYGSYRKIQKFYEIGSTIKYRCNAGYDLVGPDTAVCLANDGANTARFTTPPSCVEITTCQAPMAIDHGGMTGEKPEYYIDDIVTYYCKAGYRLVPSDGYSTCMKMDDQPSPRFTDPPSCKPIRCKRPGQFANGGFRKGKAFYAIGESVTYFCDTGFVLEGPETSICLQEEGTTVARFTTPPVCVRIECAPPASIAYGDYAKKKTRYYVGDFVTYTCDLGYASNGTTDRSTCRVRKNGKASFTPPPQCVELRCNRPRFSNGVFVFDKPMYSIGEIITFSCGIGFKLKGPDSANCTLRQRLNVARFTLLPVCIPNFCSAPDPVVYGDYVEKRPQYVVGDAVVFYCKPGYVIKGKERAACRLSKDEKSASFSPSPSCAPIRCAKPTKIRNGGFRKVKPYYDVGEIITHTCGAGFVLVGPETSTCRQNEGEAIAQFSQGPVCKRIFCDAPSLIQYGDYFEKKLRYRPGDFVTYNCDKGYKIKGKSDRSNCVMSPDGLGAAFTPPPECAALQCHQPDTIKYGGHDNERVYYAVGEIVKYFCNEGYIMEGPGTAICIQVGDYEAKFTISPVCRELGCQPPYLLKDGGYEVAKDFYEIGETVNFYCDSGFLLVGSATATCLKVVGNDKAKFVGFPACIRFRCDPPPRIPHGDYGEKKVAYSVGEIVRYGCDDGYRINGDKDTSVCELNEDKTSASFTRPPECVATQCEPPDQPKYGSFVVVKSYYSVGESVEFFCSSGFYLRGTSTATCVMAYGVDRARFTDSPECIPIQCDVPDVFHGTIIMTKPAYNIGENLVYQCGGDDYMISPKRSICTLSSDGKSASFKPAPRCVEIRCAPPDQPKHGRFEDVKEYYSIGETVEFFCESGFRVEGSVTATCVKNELVDEARFTSSPACVPIRCSSPSPISNGDYREKKAVYEIDDVVVYECDEGYQINGEPTSVCMLDHYGQNAVFTEPPKCTIVDVKCTAPPGPENGGYEITVTGSYGIGETVEFFCDPGFQLVGSSRATCTRKEGSFEAEFTGIPVCILMDVRCNTPQPPDNGSFEILKRSYTVGETITFFCDSGFRLRGPETATCLRTDELIEAEFTPFPVCIAIKCGAPDPIPHVNYIDIKPTYKIGEYVVYECDDGYRTETGREHSVCTLNPEENTASFKPIAGCVEMTCQPPDELKNGRFVVVKSFYSIGETVEFFCDSGFNLKGPETATCVSDDRRDRASFTRSPTCERMIRCGRPPFIPHGDYGKKKPAYNIGETVYYECDDGYRIKGKSHTSTCRMHQDGLSASFSQPPECVDLRCNAPQRPENGGYEIAKRYYEIGETVEFFCDSGFFMSGNRYAVCEQTEGSDEVGFTAPPICIPIQCNVPDVIHGTIIVTKPAYDIGENLVYQCGGDDYMISPKSSICTLSLDGKSASFVPPPACVEIRCAPPDQPQYGRFEEVKEYYSIDETVEFFCESGFRVEGSATATCVKNELVDEARFTSSPVCVPIRCSSPSPISNGDYREKKAVYEIDDVVVYECDEGYQINGEATSVCMLDHYGQNAVFAEPPECSIIDVKCTAPPGPENGGYEITVTGSYEVGETVEFSCDSGYQILGSSTATCIRKEGSFEAEFTVFPVCIPIQCSAADPIPHGSYLVAKPNYNVGEFVIYECDEGYKPATKLSRSVCRLDAGGNSASFRPTPGCNEIRCSPPDQPRNGRFEVVKVDYAIGESVEFFCDSGFSVKGPATATCTKANGLFRARFSNSPSCVPIRCSRPENIPNGDYVEKKRSYDIGEAVTYKCDDGYELIGDTDKSFCELHEDGLLGFFTPPPECVEVRCAPPSRPENGRYEVAKSYYTIGEAVEFFCDEGYRMSGPKTTTCKKNTGSNDAEFPTSPRCEEIRCFPPLPSDNGGYEIVKNRYAIGESVTYYCDDGFVLEGEKVSTCMLNQLDNSAYFSDPPTCRRIRCFPPSPIDNGGYENVKSRYVIGETVTYYCDDGFVIEGDKISTCTLNKLDSSAFFSDPPSCREVRCSSPKDIENGDYSEKKQYYSISEEVFYSCNEGYELSFGSNSATCRLNEDDGTAYFTNPPECLEIEVFCFSVMEIDNGNYEPKKRIYAVGDVIIYICDVNYILATGDGTSICTVNEEDYTGSFTKAPLCIPILCEPPPSVPNASYKPVTDEYTVGEIVLYTCDDGYSLSDGRLSVCTLDDNQKSASFSGRTPSCERNVCKNPGPLLGGRIIPDRPTYLYSAKITFECDFGYVLVGANEATCGNLGIFSSVLPVCERKTVSCPAPKAPAGVEYSPEKTTYGEGEKIVYSCHNPCRIASGPVTSFCKATGIFNNPPPACNLRKTCDMHPVIPWFGRIEPRSSNYTCGAIIRFFCNYGTTLVGSKLTICLPNGKFSKESPKCQVVRCNAPELNDRVYITPKYNHPYAYGAKIDYACSWGYSLTGATSAVCGQNGRFSNPSPTCIPLKCGLPEVPDNGVALLEGRTRFEVGSVVHYECNTFYVMEGENYDECNNMGKWHHGPPKCLFPSCANNCFQHRLLGRPCQCDTGCVERGDCCSDYTSECGRYTCQGRCGTTSINGSCSCSTHCRLPQFTKRCCRDYLSECEGQWYSNTW